MSSSKIIKRCFVPKCGNKSNMCDKKFLTVPVDRSRRELWCVSVGVPYASSTRLYCCEDHFKLEEDAENWMFYKTIGKNIRPKEDVVPHLNIERQTTVSEQITLSTKKRKLEVVEKFAESSKRVVKKLFTEECPSTPLPSTSQCTVYNTVSSPSGYFEVKFRGHDKGVQVNITSPKTNDATFRTTNSQPRAVVSPFNVPFKRKKISAVKSYLSVASSTGSESPQGSEWSPLSVQSSSSSSSGFALPRACVRLPSTLFLVEQYSRFYLGLPPETYRLVLLLTTSTGITSRNILITLKKIRLNDPYVRLGHDFELSSSQINRIFTSTVPALADYLQELIFWPKPEDIKKVLPIPFRARFCNVQSILDCLEIQIEKPSSAIRQAMTWSNYKNCNTIKYLISSTPNGIVNFISGGYGGRISDLEICTASGYFDLLRPGTCVMANRGFKGIDSSLAGKHCRLVRPPSVSAGERLSKAQVRLNKRIASLRIHIERVIRRVKEFNMCMPHSCVNHDIMYLMNHIMIIVCAIVNLQGRLIK